MIKAIHVFTYISSTSGVNKDGEKYFAINVLTKDSAKIKFSFVAKNQETLDKLISQEFVDYQDVKVVLSFKKNFNPKTRYSNWECELIDIERINT